MSTVAYRFLTRGGTAANLSTVNEVPLARELVVETDTRRMKLGDGETAYNDLPYVVYDDAAGLDNLDGGGASTAYGGTAPIDGGNA